MTDGDRTADEPDPERATDAADADRTSDGDGASDEDGARDGTAPENRDRPAGGGSRQTVASAADAGTTAGSESGGRFGGESVADPTEIDTAALTVEERSLHPRIRLLWIARAVLTALLTGGLVYVADAFLLEVGPILPAGVALALLVLGVGHAILRYRIWRYEVREDALYLERGVVTRVRTVVPFVRIQHVDTSRGPIERATGLATSVVYTAGSRGADVAIPGLEADRADDLQHRLKRLAIASEADTAV